jgi:uridylate kinase
VKYKRILLKLSGEMLLGDKTSGIDPKACLAVAQAIKEFYDIGIETAVVIGGGNIFRGAQIEGLNMPRSPADHMGMLATIMNGVALQQALESINCPTKVLSALECPRVVDTFTWRGAKSALEKGNVLLFVGGTGNPYFTTDSAAALRASEIKAEVLLKATKVDGVFDKDPLKYPEAKKFESITYDQYLAQNLKVMDAASIALCRGNKIPILVFNMKLLGQGKTVYYC